MSVETDPKKIAERSEQMRRVRLASRAKSAEEASEQILRHAWEAGQITEAEYRSKLAQAIAFIQKQRAEGNPS